MKKVLAFLMFSVLLFNSSVFSQKTKSVRTQPVQQVDSVVYGGARAFSDGRSVWLEWQTVSETKNLGFYIYRQTGKNRQLASEGIVGGTYLRSGGEDNSGDRYTYFDAKGDASAVYYIESLSIDGHRQLSNPIVPQIVSDLKTVAGASSNALREASEKGNSEIIKNELNLPKEMQKAVQANSLAPDIATQRWIAGQPGVKISVRKTGLYRVSKTELQNAGFNVNASPALWQLYLNGVEQSIIVAANGDYIEFYGKGMDTRESDTQVYYLLVGAQNGKRIESRTQRPIAGNVLAGSFAQTFLQKQRKIYLTDILNGDEENYFDNVPVATAGRTLTFNLPAVDFSSSKSKFTINIQGLSVAPHHIRVVLNGVELDPIFGDERTMMTKEYGIPTSYLREGDNTMQLYAMNGASDTSFLESFKIDYARLYAATNNQLNFYTNLYRASNLSGFTSPNIRVFDLTYPDSPKLVSNLSITQNGANYSVRLPSNRSFLMFAVEDSAVLPAASVVANIPSTLASAANSANFIVITHKNFTAQANTWANYRQAQGLSVKVIDIDDIYDEFSYGAQSTDGIKGFLELAKNTWQIPPRYALLIGDAYYDYRNYEGSIHTNYVPTRLVDTVYMETGSDDALADFDDDGLSEIAIGRIPARDAATVTQAFNKMTTYEATVGNWINRGAIFVSDLPIGYDFYALSERVRNQLPANMDATMIMRRDCVQPPPEEGQTLIQCLEQQRNDIRALLSTGKYIVNYSGHGSTGFWAVSNPVHFFNVQDALALTNGTNYSFYTMLTCLNGFFLGGNDSLAEALMKAPNGGASASWTSSGKTTPDVQEIMATRFYSQLTAGTMPRVGDLIVDAKTTVIGGRDVRLSWVLIGDPAMKLR